MFEIKRTFLAGTDRNIKTQEVCVCVSGCECVCVFRFQAQNDTGISKSFGVFFLTAVPQLVLERDEEFCIQVKIRRLNYCVGKKPQISTIIKAIFSKETSFIFTYRLIFNVMGAERHLIFEVWDRVGSRDRTAKSGTRSVVG